MKERLQVDTKPFKTSRLMRRGAAIIKEWFVHSRSSRKCHLDWGCTTPSSIARWLCVIEARKLHWNDGTALGVLTQLCNLGIARELDDDEGVYCLTPHGHEVYGAME